jgi:hypothetical protein
MRVGLRFRMVRVSAFEAEPGDLAGLSVAVLIGHRGYAPSVVGGRLSARGTHKVGLGRIPWWRQGELGHRFLFAIQPSVPSNRPQLRFEVGVPPSGEALRPPVLYDGYNGSSIKIEREALRAGDLSGSRRLRYPVRYRWPRASRAFGAGSPSNGEAAKRPAFAGQTGPGRQGSRAGSTGSRLRALSLSRAECVIRTALGVLSAPRRAAVAETPARRRPGRCSRSSTWRPSGVGRRARPKRRTRDRRHWWCQGFRCQTR